MLGIVLMILKIIGLLLLCILGLFFVLVLLVLFLPVSYRVWVNGDSGDIGQLVCRVKIFGIQVYPRKKGEKRKAKRVRGRTQQIKTGDEQREDADHKPADMQVSVSEPQTDTSQASAQTQASKEAAKGEKDTKKQKRPKASKKKEKTDAGRDVRGMLQKLHAEFTDEGNRRALRHLLAEIRYLLRHFGPRRVCADVEFSLGDPANTGYATAALSICPFTYGKHCHIIPDFEAEQLYLRGWLDVRGHVRCIHMLVVGIRLLSDKDIRKIIRKVLKKQ